MTQQDHSTEAGVVKALDAAHADLVRQGVEYVRNLPIGFRFTAADLIGFLPPHATDHPCRHGALIRALQARDLIEFAGYGPSRRPGNWDAPSRVWARTAVNAKGGAA